MAPRETLRHAEEDPRDCDIDVAITSQWKSDAPGDRLPPSDEDIITCASPPCCMEIE